MTSISNAMAQRDNSPAGLVGQYKNDFATMLPSHVNADQWARVAIGALRRDQKLAEAAASDPGAFLAALSNAARLGLDAGSEQFYLTPRKEKGRPTVLGIVGYQGLVDLMYRAGAVSSVIAEVVYEHDEFAYQPGRDERPDHKINWDSDDRGKLRLVYAYAVMKDGATSKVIVLNRAEINRIKKSSQGADSSYSPWQNHEAAMWLKSAVRQLAKWVPTSAEYRKEQLRAAQEVAAERAAREAGPTVISAAVQPGQGEYVDEVTGEVLQATAAGDEPVEGELVDGAGEDPWKDAVKP
ncbi:recombinase RecT [Naumannella halotolerans]|uniref:Recombination protein RecT n=1 Tax=Naumannella halotolerans TaxID=993414 RepID=A0A4R7J453_9ACTN|nr:recombinase RecT [Naumannella halotolerans]TDT31127.1 recombination protein RecT [Naumannella halotolerans]